MKSSARLLAVLAVLFTLTAAAPAHADPVECTVAGNLIIVALTGPVTFVCDGNATVTHTTTVTVDPSITISPKLFDPEPPPPGP